MRKIEEGMITAIKNGKYYKKIILQYTLMKKMLLLEFTYTAI